MVILSWAIVRTCNYSFRDILHIIQYYLLIQYMQLPYVLLMGLMSMKVVLRCSTKEHGAQSVKTNSVLMQPVWHVKNLDMAQVRQLYWFLAKT